MPKEDIHNHSKDAADGGDPVDKLDVDFAEVGVLADNRSIEEKPDT